MSSVIKQVFVLGGALAGRTIKLGNYHFVEGRHTVVGPATDVALIARFMERNWQALPEGADRAQLADLASDTLGEVMRGNDDGQRDLSTGKTKPDGGPAIQGDLQPNGKGSAPEAAADGLQPAAAQAGATGDLSDGDGHRPELNERLQRAVLALDPAEATHWTADGKPAMKAIEALYGAGDFTRADVSAVAPGLTRKTAEAKAQPE